MLLMTKEHHERDSDVPSPGATSASAAASSSRGASYAAVPEFSRVCSLPHSQFTAFVHQCISALPNYRTDECYTYKHLLHIFGISFVFLSHFQITIFTIYLFIYYLIHKIPSVYKFIHISKVYRKQKVSQLVAIFKYSSAESNFINFYIMGIGLNFKSLLQNEYYCSYISDSNIFFFCHNKTN